MASEPAGTAAMVTGASSGVGASIAGKLAARGRRPGAGKTAWLRSSKGPAGRSVDIEGRRRGASLVAVTMCVGGNGATAWVEVL